LRFCAFLFRLAPQTLSIELGAVSNSFGRQIVGSLNYSSNFRARPFLLLQYPPDLSPASTLLYAVSSADGVPMEKTLACREALLWYAA
jgi:hypothetical protein